MKNFLLLLSMTFLVGSCTDTPAEDTTQPPNIVFLFADDLSYQAIRALGNEEVHTPNIDRLAKTGTTFTHTYNMGGWNGAICVASRSMMISGQYIWSAQRMAQSWRDQDSTALTHTWGRIMERNGYDTYMSGKWHVAAPADFVFDVAKHIRPGMPKDTWGTMDPEARKLLRENNSPDLNLKEIMPVGYHRPNDENDNSWSPYDTSFQGFWKGGKHWSEVLKDDALGYIEQASQKEDPFFMYLAFNAPHDPRQAPKSFVDQYPLDKVSVPENFLPRYPWSDQIGNSPGLRDEALAPFPRTEYAVKVHRQEYYAIITHLDEQIGLILDALEASGKMDNTYIFFSADHGLSVGHHGLIGKQSLFDHSVRVPLMVAGPGIPAGQRIDQDLYLQDIMATSLEMASIEQPDYVDFKSFLGLAKGEDQSTHYAEIYGAYVNYQRMIRKDGYKLVVYPNVPKVLLFNMKEDPLEMNDLAEDAAQKDKVQTLFKDLQQLQQKMGDELDLQAAYEEWSAQQKQS
ncbi:MAG: sulfatase-like hydrolase/transferase [Saprospiraceae bacterium]|nr:sulfatase-like hydrolase/transferase [Saprospiraceae bacterium]